MKTTMATPTIQRNLSSNTRYGVTESKKAEIDALTLQVLDAQHDVELYQSILTSLTEKYNYFQGMLSTADTARAQAYTNNNTVKQLAQSVQDVVNNSKIAFNEIAAADTKTRTVAANIKIMMDKLIYAVEVINKLATTVIRKKALNPLISDELVSLIGTAGNDANNVVALALTALKSAFAAEAANMEAEAAIELSYLQAVSLNKMLTDGDGNNSSLLSLLNEAYKNSRTNYTAIEQALNLTDNQLNDAKADLNKAQINLKSLQAGLAAANAAALAS